MVRPDESQAGIWLSHQLHSDKSVYNTIELLTLPAGTDTGVLHRSLEQALNEARGLSSLFFCESGTAGSELPVARAAVERLDIRDQAPGDAAREFTRADIGTEVDLSRGPLYRPVLLTGSEGQALYLRAHHILLDGYGYHLIFRRSGEIYSNLVSGQKVRPSWFANPEDRRLREMNPAFLKSSEEQKSFWSDELKQWEPPATPVSWGGDLTRETCSASGSPGRDVWKSMCSGRGKNTALWADYCLAALALVVAESAGSDVVVPGFTVMNRADPVTLCLPSTRMNILPCRIRADPGMSLSQFLSSVALKRAELIRRQSCRHEWMREQLRLAGRSDPVFSPVLNIIPWGGRYTFGRFSGVRDVLEPGPVTGPVFTVRAGEGVLPPQAEVRAPSCMFSKDDTRRILESFNRHLRRFSENPLTGLAEYLPAIFPKKVPSGPESCRPIKEESPLYWLEANSRRMPEKQAFAAAGGESLSWKELYTVVCRMAFWLKLRGPGRGRTLLLVPDNGIRDCVIMLASMLRGVAFCSVSPERKEPDLTRFIGEVRPDVLLTSSPEKIPRRKGMLVLKIPGLNELNCGRWTDRFPRAWEAACTFFTSGSGGKARAVSLTHGNLANFMRGVGDRYGVSRQDRILRFAPLSFDTSLEEIFLSFWSGATLIFPAGGFHKDISGFEKVLKEEKISVLDLPTAYWHEWVRTMQCFPEGNQLRLVIIGGEYAERNHLQKWFRLQGGTPVLVNSYGPTEASVVVSAGELHPAHCDWPRLPMGYPLCNAEIWIVNRAGEEAEEGELLIGEASTGRHGPAYGSSLASLCRINGSFRRAYRTGDMVRTYQGQLLFLGRKDYQFKISGYKVQPEDLEQLIVRVVPGVKEAVVACSGRSHGGKVLRCWLVSEKPVNQGYLAGILARHLPPALIPVAEVLPSLPRNSNGKYDRKRLKERPGEAESRQDPAIREPLLKKIQRIWEEVLGLKNAGADASFFALGGSSLQSIRIVSMINEECGVRISTRDLFQYPVLQDFAQLVTRSQPAGRKLWTGLGAEDSDEVLHVFYGAGGGPEDFLTLSQNLRSWKIRVGEPSAADQTDEADMAEVFAGYLRKNAAGSRIFTGGHSLGGLLAFNVARILDSEGFRVVLILFDSFLSPGPEERMKWNGSGRGAESLNQQQWWQGLSASGCFHGDVVRYFATGTVRTPSGPDYRSDNRFFEKEPADFLISGSHQSMLRNLRAVDFSWIRNEEKREL